MGDELKSGLPPILGPDPSLLILGSLPGDRSLTQQRYYAHQTNQFWRLLEPIMGAPFAALPYEERLARLAQAGLALWDVVGSAQRIGSADSTIRSARTNALAEFIAGLPSLRAVAFNGATAARLGRRALGRIELVELIDLPSSSAANTLPFAAKAETWLRLARHLRSA